MDTTLPKIRYNGQKILENPAQLTDTLVAESHRRNLFYIIAVRQI